MGGYISCRATGQFRRQAVSDEQDGGRAHLPKRPPGVLSESVKVKSKRWISLLVYRRLPSPVRSVDHVESVSKEDTARTSV